MGTLLNRRRYMGGVSEPPLPSGIIPVEYITIGSGGFAISLELVPDSYTKSELDISVAGSRTPVIYGTSWVSDNNDYRLFWHGSNALYWDIGNKRVNLGMSSYYSYNERFKVILGNLYLTLPDKNKTVSGTTVAYTPYDQSELGFRNTCTIYGVKVWDTSSNSLLRDCIPVRVETTGYLYDKVRGQLCVNNITNITPGPDKT